MDYEGQSDHGLMEAAGKGDMRAFTALVDRHKNWLINFVYNHLRDFQVAEDIAQEAFVRVYKKVRTYNTKALFTTWLYIIALNLLKTEIRRRKAHIVKKESELKAAKPQNDSDGVFANMPSARERGTDTESITVWECLDFMDMDEKNILILRDIQGFDYEELAEILDCPVGTVKSRLNRARLKFKELYARHTK